MTSDLYKSYHFPIAPLSLTSLPPLTHQHFYRVHRVSQRKYGRHQADFPAVQGREEGMSSFVQPLVQPLVPLPLNRQGQKSADFLVPFLTERLGHLCDGRLPHARGHARNPPGYGKWRFWSVTATFCLAFTPPNCQLLTTAAPPDIIELGVPFTDPIADGPTIQTSNTVSEIAENTSTYSFH